MAQILELDECSKPNAEVRGSSRTKNIILSLVISSLLIFGCGEKKEPVEEYFPEISPTASQMASGTSIFDTLEASAHRKTVQRPDIFVQMGHVSSGYTSKTAADFTPDGSKFCPAIWTVG